MIVEENLSLELEPNRGWDSRIHIAKCADMVRAYVIVCQRLTVVYDTLLGPKSGKWLSETASRLSESRPILVINSHADWDHYFGNMNFSGLPILASRLCAERIQGDSAKKELATKRAEHPNDYDSVQLLSPSILIEGEATLDGGDLTLKLLKTPGHRPDHLALWLPDIATLLPGDCVEDPIPLVDEDSTPASSTICELKESLEAMSALKPEWVLANHAPPEPGLSRLQSNIAYLQKLQDYAKNATSLEELQHTLPPDSAWASFYRDAHHNQVRMAWEQARA